MLERELNRVLGRRGLANALNDSCPVLAAAPGNQSCVFVKEHNRYSAIAADGGANRGSS